MPIKRGEPVPAGADPHYAGSAGDILIQSARCCALVAATKLTLLPMVTSIDEVDEARRSIEPRRARGRGDDAIPKTAYRHYAGSAVHGICAPHLANRIDFYLGRHQRFNAIYPGGRSQQYCVASIYDSLHLAMLRASSGDCAGSEKWPRFACARDGGRSRCVAILIGLGYRHLSTNGRSVARVKYLLRHIDFEDAQTPARRSLEAQMATEVRHQVAALWSAADGDWIRGGLYH